MQNRGSGDTRKAVQTPRAGRPGAAKTGPPQDALTRVTHETEVRGTETRVERVVERAPKPSLPDVDRASAVREIGRASSRERAKAQLAALAAEHANVATRMSVTAVSRPIAQDPS